MTTIELAILIANRAVLNGGQWPLRAACQQLQALCTRAFDEGNVALADEIWSIHQDVRGFFLPM
jgi:hypothetical protein